MTDTGMHYGSFIPEEFVTEWYREINEYELQYKPTMFARNYLPYRSVGENIDIDSVTYLQSTESRAQFIAKGAIPEPFTARGRTEKHEMYCIATGFSISGRDLAKPQGATMKTKELDIAMSMIHAQEDYTAINGDGQDILGIVNAARANTNGKVAASAGTYNNMGAWDGSDSTRDPYEDINLAMTLNDFNITPKYLLGNRTSLAYLNTMDSERIPFYKQISGLFGKSETDRSWMVESQFCPSGYVYVLPFDPKAMEFVVSQDITIDDAFAKQAGDNYYVELRAWLNPCEIHLPNGCVEVNIQ